MGHTPLFLLDLWGKAPLALREGGEGLAHGQPVERVARATLDFGGSEAGQPTRVEWRNPLSG